MCLCAQNPHKSQKEDKEQGKSFFVTLTNLFLLVSSFYPSDIHSILKRTREILLHYVWTKAIDYRLVILMQNIFEFFSFPLIFFPLPHHSLERLPNFVLLLTQIFRFLFDARACVRCSKFSFTISIKVPTLQHFHLMKRLSFIMIFQKNLN